MLRTHYSMRGRYRRNFGVAIAMALGFATTVASPSQAQWFGPNCRSLAQEQLKDIGPQLTELYAAAARNDNQALLGLALTGSVGAITFNRPIEVQVRSVEATAIERSNVQTRCRVRAPATITFGRPGIWVEATSSGPQLKRGNRDDTLEGEIVYDFVFAGREILESGLESFMIVALVTYSTLRQREEQADPDVSGLIRQEQAEQQRRSNEARVRAENERLIREEEQARARRDQSARANARAHVNELDRTRRQLGDRIGTLENQIANYRREIERLQFPSPSVGSGVDAASDREYRARIRASREREIARLTAEIRDMEGQVRAVDESRARALAAITTPERTQPPLTQENIRSMPSSRELDAITAWASRCFDVPAAVRGELLATPVRVRIRFALDGSLAAAPEAIEVGGSEVDRMLSEAAVRAVRRCANEGSIRLPRERYEAWRDVTLTFTPN